MNPQSPKHQTDNSQHLPIVDCKQREGAIVNPSLDINIQTAEDKLFTFVELVYGKKGNRFAKLIQDMKQQARQDRDKEILKIIELEGSLANPDVKDFIRHIKSKLKGERE